MLVELVVRNLVIVEEARLVPGAGLTVVSGETGAGKSLLLDALDLLCGGRPQGQVVGRWGEAATVSAVFAVEGVAAQAVEAATAIPAQDGSFILRRRLSAAGRSQAWINDTPVTIAALRAAADHLVEIHAQHEPLRIADPAVQLAWLDGHGGHGELAERYAQTHARVAAQTRALAELDGGERESVRELDYLRFQVREFEALQPAPGELARLEERHRLLSSAGEWRHLAAAATDELTDHDRSVVRVLGRLAKRLGEAPDPVLQAAGESCRVAAELVGEAGSACARAADALEADPAELARVDERLTMWHDLARKHGDGEDALLAAWERIAARVQALATIGERRATLAASLEEDRALRGHLGSELAQARTKGFKRLAKAVHGHLAELGMPKAVLSLAEHPGEPTALGTVAQEFAVCTNPGLPAGSLRHIASGGELARIALGLTAALAAQDRIGLLVFDEVDSGVGGRLGTVIGGKLAHLAQGRTVLAITHTPQLAACAGRHYLVRKTQGEHETTVMVTPLAGDDRVRELADMLGGGSPAVTQAQALLAASAGGR